MNQSKKLVTLISAVLYALVGAANVEAMEADTHGIAVIGWGSLTWKPGILEKQGEFMPGGPTLPIAFSRVSGNGILTLVIDPQSDAEGRKPADHAGRDVQTWYAQSKYAINKLDDAITNLRKREGAPKPVEGSSTHPIGYVNLIKKAFRISQINPNTGNTETIRGRIDTVSGQAAAVEIVNGSGIRRELIPSLKGLIAWTKRKGFDAAIWTDLQPNFHDKTGKPFNQDNAQAHLFGLERAARITALEYITKAPVRSQTRDGDMLKRALEGNLA